MCRGRSQSRVTRRAAFHYQEWRGHALVARRAGFSGRPARGASQNSSTAAATTSGSRWAVARRAAAWKRISYRCPESLITCQVRGDGPDPGEQWPNQRQARRAPGRPGFLRCATASESPRISKVISRPSKVIDREQDCFGLSVAVKVIRSCCWRTRLASSDRRTLASDSGTGVAAIDMVKNIGRVSLILDQPSRRRRHPRRSRCQLAS